MSTLSVKWQHRGLFHRFSVTTATYEEVLKRMKLLVPEFDGKFAWKDSDGDLIVVGTTMALQEAVRVLTADGADGLLRLFSLEIEANTVLSTQRVEEVKCEEEIDPIADRSSDNDCVCDEHNNNNEPIDPVTANESMNDVSPKELSKKDLANSKRKRQNMDEEEPPLSPEVAPMSKRARQSETQETSKKGAAHSRKIAALHQHFNKESDSNSDKADTGSKHRGLADLRSLQNDFMTKGHLPNPLVDLGRRGESGKFIAFDQKPHFSAHVLREMSRPADINFFRATKDCEAEGGRWAMLRSTDGSDDEQDDEEDGDGLPQTGEKKAKRKERKGEKKRKPRSSLSESQLKTLWLTPEAAGLAVGIRVFVVKLQDFVRRMEGTHTEYLAVPAMVKIEHLRGSYARFFTSLAQPWQAFFVAAYNNFKGRIENISDENTVAALMEALCAVKNTVLQRQRRNSSKRPLSSDQMDWFDDYLRDYFTLNKPFHI